MSPLRLLSPDIWSRPAASGERFLTLVSYPASRYLVAILLAVATYRHTPPLFRNLAAWDVFALLYIALTMLVIVRRSPEETRYWSQRREPSNKVVIASTMITAVAAIVAVAEGSLKLRGISQDKLIVHAFLSMIGVITAWLFLNVNFSLHYARIYYNDKHDDNNPDTFQEGLEFPGGSNMVNYWDFVYYSFTIAMCYQTSDVTITSPDMRRLTILHAIFSFLFVLLLFGMVVNIIANVI